ncbi:calcium-activated potassium channel subunit alpha-1-like isoform X3 [Narcine bancroftii]|uniref:calcium-activated potassium channel subunit alpha-1-like isoform X3 n=1 Tax=Narcine bancroftii TaxID=1343680 RepID=UPI003831B01B
MTHNETSIAHKMGNLIFAKIRSKLNGVIDPLTKRIIDSGEIWQASKTCHVIHQDMWWGAIGSSFTVFAGGLLLILLSRGIRIFYVELSKIFRGQSTWWKKNKTDTKSHNVVITGKHKISHLVLEDAKDILTLQEIEQLNVTETSKLRKVSLMTEVQEWAQRMISAQSLIGRGLVMMVFLLSFGSLFIYFVISIEIKEHTHVILKTLQVVDMGFNTFFLFYFGIRFIAAEDKLRFWVELNSIVDFFTIPPVIFSLFFNQDCIGLRFMRSLRLLQLPEILQYLRILKRHTKIKLASLLSVFLGTWLTAAGFVHMIENSGDPWREEINSQPLTYWQSVYLLMVTMSTVGYGDLTAKTTVGQVFMMFFIILGLALFASHVPEIIELIGSHRKYTGSYHLVRSKKHIILCGHITLSILHEFLKDFTQKEREESSTKIVIMEDFNPGLELQALFKCHITQMQFFQGSVLKPTDLVRIQLDKANACLILADKNCLNPEAEDSANIMRVIAVKQYCPEIRIIAQVLQYHSKVYLQNLPSWNMKQRDSVICLNELKMGFIAQNCIVPGFSTLLANLFIKKSQMEHKTGTWLDIYQEGVSQEIFTEFLSESFVGMTFPAVCELCYIKLKLLLIAIQYRTSDESVSILINPDTSIVIHEQTLGFFIAKKRSLVLRANFYCTDCHSDISDLRRIKECRCKKPSSKEKLFYNLARMQSLGVLPVQGSSSTERMFAVAKEKVNLDSTGMFHWCPPKSINQVTLNRAMASRLHLSNHVIVCIFSEPKCPAIGLRNFVMPLRASSFTYDELKSIVFVVSLEYIAKEWGSISNFPKVFILPGSPLCRADLKAVSIGTCDMTVIISSNRTNFEEKSLQDKECILATLNLKAMLFEDTKEMLTRSSETLSPGLFVLDTVNKHYYRIPIMTSLVHQSNAYFLDQEDRDEPDTDLYLMQPYASGCVFAFSILNSLMCTTYFNDNILMLIRTLVTGGATPELDEQLADEDALRGSVHAQDKVGQRNRCKLARISLCDKRFNEFANGGKYGDLFCRALLHHGILCFGIFRMQNPEKQSKKRYVITNPPSSFELIETDFIMCTVPFDDTQTMATSTYCRMNYYSKFIPFHTVARHSSTATKPVKINHTIYNSNQREQAWQEEDEDQGHVEIDSDGEAEVRIKPPEPSVLEHLKEKLKSMTALRTSSDKIKLPLVLKVHHFQEDQKSGDIAGISNYKLEDDGKIISAGEPGFTALKTGAEIRDSEPESVEDSVDMVLQSSEPPVLTTPRSAVEPVSTTSSPGVETWSTTPRPAVEPVPTTPRPGVEPGSTTPRPGVEPGSTTPRPGVEPVPTTPRPAVEPVPTTPRPGVEPVPTTPRPAVEPVSTTPRPGVEPGSTTPRPWVEPVSMTPRPGVEPGSTTSRPGVEPGSTTPRPAVEPVPMTPRPEVEPGSTTPRPWVEPVSMTPRLGVEPGSTTARPGVEPGSTTPTPGVEPESTTPRLVVEPVPTKPRSGVEPVSTTPRSGLKPGSNTPRPKVEPIPTTSKPDVETRSVEPK